MRSRKPISWTTAIRCKAGLIASLLAIAALLSTGCASSGGGSRASDAGPSVLTAGRTVGQVSVAVGAELPSDVAGIADQFSVAENLEAGIRRLVPGGVTPSSGSLLVNVEIVKMRVRSTASAIWWGMMAGADVIDVHVSVSENGHRLKDFETGVSTSLGGFIYGAQGKRITRMIDALSKRIAADL